MTARSAQARRRCVDGVLLFDKPAGLTSQAAVSRVKGLYNAAKAGHTGTLDPMATGLLPVAFGEATKFSSALLDARKSYLATIRLGVTTTTGDLEGEVSATSPVDVDLSRISAVLTRFTGEILQTPPMYSALKHAGKPLYEYARKGIELPRVPRRVTVAELALLEWAGTELKVRVTCSKGTYIRALAGDIGKALGCGACLAALRRTQVGPFDVADAIALDVLSELSEPERATYLLPVDAMLADLPVLDLDPEQARRVTNGREIECARAPGSGLVRLRGPGGAFLGVAETVDAGSIRPRRLIAAKAANLEKTGTY